MAEVFLDTSGLYALVVAEDVRHADALGTLQRLRDEGAELVTSSFVLQETIALLQARVGLPAVRALAERLLVGARVIWVGPEVFGAALAALLAAQARTISLTDWSSFEVMRRGRIERAFAFDEDFIRQGFVLA
jgi:uncharacterized protein